MTTGGTGGSATRNQDAFDAQEINELTLVVCDEDGRIRGVTPSFSKEVIPCSLAGRKHFSQVFGENSGLSVWLTEQAARARSEREVFAESRLEGLTGMLFVRFESLVCEDEAFGFLITLMPAGSAQTVRRLEDGDAVVSRKQWHEIKNHIGALKLYTTFLNRAPLEGEAGQTAEKILRGINGLIDFLARIRRGESK